MLTLMKSGNEALRPFSIDAKARRSQPNSRIGPPFISSSLGNREAIDIVRLSVYSKESKVQQSDRGYGFPSW